MHLGVGQLGIRWPECRYRGVDARAVMRRGLFLGMRLAAWWRVADVHALGSRCGWGVVACLCLFCASRLDFVPRWQVALKMPYGRRRRAGRVSIAGTKLTWCGVDNSRHAVDWFFQLRLHTSWVRARCRTVPLSDLRISSGRFSCLALIRYQIRRFMVVPKVA